MGHPFISQKTHYCVSQGPSELFRARPARKNHSSDFLFLQRFITAQSSSLQPLKTPKYRPGLRMLLLLLFHHQAGSGVSSRFLESRQNASPQVPFLPQQYQCLDSWGKTLFFRASNFGSGPAGEDRHRSPTQMDSKPKSSILCVAKLNMTSFKMGCRFIPLSYHPARLLYLEFVCSAPSTTLSRHLRSPNHYSTSLVDLFLPLLPL